MILETEVEIQYIVLINQDLKDIDYRKKLKDDLILRTISVDPKYTFGDLLMKIQKKIKSSLPAN